MSNPNPARFKYLICWVPFVLAALVVNAQKLPAKQEISLRAPKNVKADGKLTEWGALQAHNTSTGLNYTLANNNEALFVVIQATDPSDIKKILIGNITFTINTGGAKADKGGMSLTFPYVRGTGGTSIGIKLAQPITAVGPEAQAKQTDSLVQLMNEDMSGKAKEIMAIGFKELPEGMLSVYNEESIKVAEAFDHNRALNFEIAIPLKYLGLKVGEPIKFGYSIMLNGLEKKDVVVYPDGGPHAGVVVIGTPMGLSPGAGRFNDFVYPTSFSGEYTLVK